MLFSLDIAELAKVRR